jgi:hypothetical protein
MTSPAPERWPACTRGATGWCSRQMPCRRHECTEDKCSCPLAPASHLADAQDRELEQLRKRLEVAREALERIVEFTEEGPRRKPTSRLLSCKVIAGLALEELGR